ncbi:uncharacterized protein PG998_012334 [Apiospora kogelbergensis]|uniref:uncharacterized protein n=1 Tax=Apiospora kogelbergensis TaxID=1337665 RepID=UPI00312F2C49
MGRNEQGRFASGQPELKPGQPASCQQGPSMLQNEPVRIPTLSNCWKSRASMRSASQEHAQPGTAKWLEMEMEGCFGMHQAFCTQYVTLEKSQGSSLLFSVALLFPSPCPPPTIDYTYTYLSSGVLSKTMPTD